MAASTTLRDVALKLGAKPASGTLSHLRRRIAAADIDVSHFQGLSRACPDAPFTRERIEEAAAASDSIRSMARYLGVPESDTTTRAALRRMLTEHGVDITHFSHTRIAIPEAPLREAVAECTSYADVMRALGLPVDRVNHRRVRAG